MQEWHGSRLECVVVLVWGFSAIVVDSGESSSWFLGELELFHRLRRTGSHS